MTTPRTFLVRSRRPLRGVSVALTSALALGVLAGSAGVALADARSDVPGTGDRASGGSATPPQTSDGVVGPLAPEVSGSERRAVRRTNESRTRVSPGLTFSRWDQTDARGQVRAYLLDARLDRPGLSVDYIGGDQVQTRTKMKALVRRDGGVAGVNGDFFDISDTGAPVGVGVKKGVTLHGPAQPLGWNLSFVINPDGSPTIKRLPTRTTITARPGIRVTNVNGPHVIEQGIGLYTERWGTAPGYRVLEGAPHRSVRQVVIQNGKVVSNTRTVWRDRPVVGNLLLGRGKGAETLRQSLPVGTRTRVVLGTVDAARVAISGNALLLRDGAIVTNDDGEMHPRTAIGIDRDTNRLLLLVIDGRQEFSRGYTMLELARMMQELGAEDALNFDGGGSSTVIGRKTNGRLGVLNSPSDGQQRPVANGLAVHYDAPR